MPFLILLLILISPHLPFLNIEALSSYLHGKCLDTVSFDSPWKSIYKALVCGKRLPQGSIKEVFSEGGLIHLMVVSGAHLLFLEKFYLKLPLPIPQKLQNFCLYFLILVFAVTTTLKAPILKSVFSFCLFRISKSKKLFLNSVTVTVLSGFLCLVYNPSWINSYSLQLSLLASLVYSFRGFLKKSILIYIFLLPIINHWTQLHPISIFINWIFAPIIGSLLFPLSFMSVLFWPLHLVTDLLWSIAFNILQLTEFLPDKSLFSWRIPKKLIWIYIAALAFLFYKIDIYQKSRNSRKNQS